MTIPDAQPEAQRLWRAALEKVKVRLVLPGVWRAMEAARPLVIDGDYLVLGYPPSVANDGGLLRDSKNSNVIERALEEEAGRPRRYAEMPLRQLPQMQALYLEEAVSVLAEAARRLLGENAAEVDQRGFARVLEKVADRAQVPAAFIAWLVRQKSGG